MHRSITVLPTIVFVALCGALGYHAGAVSIGGSIAFFFWLFSVVSFVGGMVGHIMTSESDHDYRVSLDFARLFFWSGTASITAYIVGSWLWGAA